MSERTRTVGKGEVMGKEGEKVILSDEKDRQGVTILSSKENLNKLDADVLGAVIRQRAHWLDRSIELLAARATGRSSSGIVETAQGALQNARRVVAVALEVWRECGYSVERPDIKFAVETLERGERFTKDRSYPFLPLPKPFDESGLRAIEDAIYKRRSVRLFRDEDVPDELVKKIIHAGTWAPTACDVQGVRYIVLKDPDRRNLIGQKYLAAASVIILVGVDSKGYSLPGLGKDNDRLDTGAAVQNMLIMAHALGLATCWGTQNFAARVPDVYRELQIPDNIEIITYIALGWPAHTPSTPLRMEVTEVAYKDAWGSPL